MRASLGGSGTLSHVYIQHPPLRCSIPGIQGLFYDDGNKLLIAPTSDQVLYWTVGPSTQPEPPNSDSISEGPVLSIRYSLDLKAIAIQRSIHEVQFKNRETGQTFSRNCRPDSERILGFFWTDCPTCDIIIIKTSGIDLLSYEPEVNALRLVESKRFNVTWYVYTHETRMVLLASGMQSSTFSGYQFSSAGIVRLPKFEMILAKAEANNKPVLAADDVNIITVYGRIYCLQLDRFGMVLNLYRFYRDAVVQQGTLPVYSSRIAVNVVDNVLLVHQVDAKVVILYDIFLDSLTPISAPLPLLLRAMSSCSRIIDQDENSLSSAYGGTIYAESWSFLMPDLICDTDNGLLWRVSLDLEAIAASSSDIPSILEFLQRRRSDPNTIKPLCLAIMRSLILERRPIMSVARAIDVLVASYTISMRMGGAVHGVDRAFSEQTQHPDNHLIDGTNVAQEPTSGTTNQGKSVRKDSMSGVENEPQESTREAGHKPDDPTAESRLNRTLFHSASDSGDDTYLDVAGVNLDQPHERSLRIDDYEVKTQTKSDAQTSNTISCASYQQGSKLASVSISPDEMYNFVFKLVEDEISGDPGYLVAIIIEFLWSASQEKLKVHPDLYVMTIKLLARTKRFSEMALFVLNKILEPSKEVALQLVESGHQNLLTRKLGMDMLRQLSLHNDYVALLLQDGYYLEALHYIRKYKVITVQPALFLEAAVASNNPQNLAAVLRFLSDFTPSFKTTSDYSRYHHILTEMS